MRKLKIKITYDNLEFCKNFLNKERYLMYNEHWIPDRDSIRSGLFLHYPSPSSVGDCYGATEDYFPGYELVTTEEFKKTFTDIKERLKTFKI
jgi:hypothetical protein